MGCACPCTFDYPPAARGPPPSQMTRRSMHDPVSWRPFSHRLTHGPLQYSRNGAERALSPRPKIARRRSPSRLSPETDPHRNPGLNRRCILFAQVLEGRSRPSKLSKACPSCLQHPLQRGMAHRTPCPSAAAIRPRRNCPGGRMNALNPVSTKSGAVQLRKGTGSLVQRS